MEYTTLGRTGLQVSVAGLGCGGFSRLGLGTGKTTEESIAVVRRALDLGVNFIDTAAAYGTEDIVGAALDDVDRDSVVISTKAMAPWADPDAEIEADRIVASIDRSLQRLRTDHLDVLHLHGVPPNSYERVRDQLVPTLLDQREAGKISHIGITEIASQDHRQEMLQVAVREEPWDVVMLAFHLMHQQARHKILPTTSERGVGTLMMFVVRSIFSQPERLREVVDELIADGRLAPELAEDPLGFLMHGEGGGDTLMDAAYRYARHEPGVDVVLFGTGEVDHVDENVASILAPPLPATDKAKVDELFGHLEGVGLDVPPRNR